MKGDATHASEDSDSDDDVPTCTARAMAVGNELVLQYPMPSSIVGATLEARAPSECGPQARGG